jgi:hypothetical protein
VRFAVNIRRGAKFIMPSPFVAQIQEFLPHACPTFVSGWAISNLKEMGARLSRPFSLTRGPTSRSVARSVARLQGPEQNTREQIKKVRSHPWIAKEVPVGGFIFDVETVLSGKSSGFRSTPLPEGRWLYEICQLAS